MFSRLITRDRSLRKQQQQQQQHEAQKEPPVRKNQAEKQSSLCHKEGEQTQAKPRQRGKGEGGGVTCSGCEVNQFMQSASSGEMDGLGRADECPPPKWSSQAALKRRTENEAGERREL